MEKNKWVEKTWKIWKMQNTISRAANIAMNSDFYTSSMDFGFENEKRDLYIH